jgi:hypothetical protein
MDAQRDIVANRSLYAGATVAIQFLANDTPLRTGNPLLTEEVLR